MLCSLQSARVLVDLIKQLKKLGASLESLAHDAERDDLKKLITALEGIINSKYPFTSAADCCEEAKGFLTFKPSGLVNDLGGKAVDPPSLFAFLTAGLCKPVNLLGKRFSGSLYAAYSSNLSGCLACCENLFDPYLDGRSLNL